MSTVLITGASSDIGTAICRLYLANKCHVLGLYNQGQLALTNLAEENPKLTLLQLDFETPENIENFLQEEREQLLESEIIIHAAAMVEPVPFSDITADNLLRAFTVNVIPSILFISSVASISSASCKTSEKTKPDEPSPRGVNCGEDSK